jgi:Domain of unknown function (DUF1990)
VSPISHRVGGQSPTNRARRSALPRSSWSTVLARIHKPMHNATEPRDASCRCALRSPARRSVPVMVTLAPPTMSPPAADRPAWHHTSMAGDSGPARLATVLRWPLGIAVVSWRYMWRTTPMHRSEEAGSATDLPEHWDQDADSHHGRQGFAAGAGQLLHRTYAVRIAGSAVSPAELIEVVAANLNRASPEMAVFRKTRGADGALRPGDEFVVRMPGPWDGPVRVTRRDATSFRLATLDGHLEAGEIEFRAAADGDMLRFEIESWARAGDRLADLLYNRLRLAKEIQLNMWTHFCIRAAALAGGRLQGGVTIRTRWVPWPPLGTVGLANLFFTSPATFSAVFMALSCVLSCCLL